MPPVRALLLFLAMLIPMVVVALYTFRGVALQPTQLVWIIAATATLALISAWVIARL